jgi:hypothetical protein
MAQLRMTIIWEVAALLNYMIRHEENLKLDRQPCQNQETNLVTTSCFKLKLANKLL